MSILLLVSLYFGITSVLITPSYCSYQNSASHTIVSQKEYQIYEGMTETSLVLNNSSGKRVEGHMVEIKPGAPVSAKVSYPGYYYKNSTEESRAAFADAPVWTKKTTTAQAADYTAVTKQPVLYATNSDNFKTEDSEKYTMGQACGYLIMEGNVIQTTEMTARPFFAVLTDGSFAIRDAGSNLSDVVEATSGRLYLVKDGKNVVDKANSDSLGLMPYNSIGLKADGTLVTFLVDGRRSDSVGMTEMEMADYLISQGVVDALIFDGGGSATIATRRSGESSLSLRNQPSDGTERAIGATLMFIPAEPELYFDFGNTSRDQVRYSGYAYEGTNFDSEDCWRPTVNTSDYVTIDQNRGTMTLTKTASNTLSYFYAQTWSTDSSDRYKLHYRPDHADFLQVRMRISGFDPAISNTTFSVHYYADGSSTQITYAVSYSFGKGYVFDGSDILLTLPIAQKFRDAEFIDSVKLNFGNFSGTGTVELDYIYIGPENSLPEQDHLYYDFRNTPMDARRYKSLTYGYENYDLGSWGYNGKKSSAPQIDGEFLNFSVMETTDNYINTGHSPYIQTTDIGGNLEQPILYYTPGKEDYFQIRFRIQGCTSVPGKKGSVRIYFAAEDSITFVGNEKYEFTSAEMDSGGYQVVTLPLYTNQAYQSVKRINTFRLNFQNVCLQEGKSGSISIDYIYIGDKASMPHQEQLLFTFNDQEIDRQRYDSRTYAFRNYDQGNWGYNAKKSSRPVISDGTLSFSVMPTTDNYVNTGHSPYIQTSDGGGDLNSPMLRYEPGQEDYLQIRFKMQSCEAVPGASAALRFYFATGESVSFAGNVKRDLTASEMTSGQYLVATMPLYGLTAYKEAERINLFRLNFQNVRSSDSESGEITIDYIFVGPKSALPTPQYTIRFLGADGSVLKEQTVHKGESASYTGTTPQKAYTEYSHFTFVGWDKPLTNISGDLTVTAVFTEVSHSCSYSKIDGSYHKSSCVCGYSKTESHSCTYKATKDPTTSDIGTLTGICSRCSITTTVTLPKLTTTDYIKTTTRTATCTATGVDKYTWKTTTYGSFSFNVTTAAKGHTSVTDPFVAPTCTATGLTEGKHCSVCSTVLTAQKIVPAKGHTEVVDKAVEATCTETGLTEGKHCSACNTVLIAQEVVPANGHEHTYAKVNALIHTLGCVNCDFTEEASHTYTDGFCICGEPEIKEPIVDASLKLSHSLNLASDISVNFVVPKTLLAGFDMDTVYVESTIEVYEGNIKVGTNTVRMQAVDNGYTYYFTLTGLTAVQMNNRISSVLYGTKDGQPYYSNIDDYAIADYAYSQLNKTNTSEKLRVLCADLLLYGTKAQIYKSYRTDALADQLMTEVHRSYLSDTESVIFANINVDLKDLSNAPISWAGKSLNLDSKVCLKFVFRTTAYMGNVADLNLRVSYEDRTGETRTLVLTQPEIYSETAQLYSFTVDALLAAELRSAVSVQIFAGDKAVSSTLRYSPDTYGNNKTGTLLDLCKALFAYSDSARAYFIP